MPMSEIKTEIVVTLQVPGFHNWPDAPEEVGFLREKHRHTFVLRLRKPVNHLDRDIEIILFKGEVLDFLHRQLPLWDGSPDTLDFGPMSCEMIAMALLQEFSLSSAEVLEDGLDGAIVTRVEQ